MSSSIAGSCTRTNRRWLDGHRSLTIVTSYSSQTPIDRVSSSLSNLSRLSADLVTRCGLSASRTRPPVLVRPLLEGIMFRRVFSRMAIFAAFALLLIPAAVSAQSSITGLVKDSSGGVLPGVTVVATSPALIERTRSVVTDAQGRYTVLDLRPGVYKVTFTLSGFKTVIQNGIDLPSNFTATVNADLTLGAMEESVTVTGEAPTVDGQNAQRTTVLSRDLLDAVPVPRTYQAEGELAVGTRK